jgi:hypothetical protein
MAAEQVVQAFHEGNIYSFVQAGESSPSTFGGPLPFNISGATHGPRPLHLIAHLSQRQMGVKGSAFSSGVPLIYGMSYEGCEIRYQVKSTKIEILEIDPVESSENWPYKHYPFLLPHVPLTPLKPRPSTYADFGSGLENNNISHVQRKPLVVVVPPPATLGFSMWGQDGDADGVIVIFECDPETGIIYAHNQAS